MAYYISTFNYLSVRKIATIWFHMKISCTNSATMRYTNIIFESMITAFSSHPKEFSSCGRYNWFIKIFTILSASPCRFVLNYIVQKSLNLFSAYMGIYSIVRPVSLRHRT